MSYSLSEAAQRELDQAFSYLLDNVSQKVAERFLQEFDRAASLIDANPGLGTQTLSGRRVFPIRRYPYFLVYRMGNHGAEIGAVAHQNRKPQYWSSRG